MYALDFPNMFSGTKVKLIEDHEATYNNLKLLLLSEKTGLFGDPYFGTNLQKVIYSQNGAIIRDLIVDAIYSAIVTFMPQIKVNRNDIVVKSRGTKIYATITALNKIDYVKDVYDILLVSGQSENR